MAEIRGLPASPSRKRPLGFSQGPITIPDSYFQPLPDELLKGFRDNQSKSSPGYLHIPMDHYNTLSPVSREIFSDPTHETFLSAISVWEMLVKFSLGKIQLPIPVDQFICQQRERHGIGTPSLEEAATGHVPKLPHLHRDPFDRMLICQALTILTPDPFMTQYVIRTVW